MKKRGSIFLLATCVALIVNGCGSAPKAPPSPTPTNTSILPTAAAVLPPPTTSVGAPRALMVLFPSFEEREYGRTRQVLEEHGIAISIAAPTPDTVRGHVDMAVQPDVLLRDAHAADYDAVIFVGAYEFDFDDPDAIRIAQEAAAEQTILAAICAAPRILARAGVLEGKRATTSLPPAELEQAGAIYTGVLVERDGCIITANGPYASQMFGQAIAEALEEPSQPALTPDDSGVDLLKASRGARQSLKRQLVRSKIVLPEEK